MYGNIVIPGRTDPHPADISSAIRRTLEKIQVSADIQQVGGGLAGPG
jgi:hypothetical protein